MTLTYLLIALWEYQARHDGQIPDDVSQAAEIEEIAAVLLAKLEINKQALSTIPRSLVE